MHEKAAVKKDQKKDLLRSRLIYLFFSGIAGKSRILYPLISLTFLVRAGLNTLSSATLR